ncbi:MAG: chemotaxis protein CheW, partial [Ferrovibrio sp.]
MNRFDALLINVGDQTYALSLLQIQEIRGWTAVSGLPNTDAACLGVLNLRGSVLDPFGQTEERRMERALIVQYLGSIEEILGTRRMFQDLQEVAQPAHEALPRPIDLEPSALHQCLEIGEGRGVEAGLARH